MAAALATTDPLLRSRSLQLSRSNTKKLVGLLVVGCALLFTEISSTKKFLPDFLFDDVAPKLAVNVSQELHDAAPGATSIPAQILEEELQLEQIDEHDLPPGSLFDPVEVSPQCSRNSTQRKRVIDIIWVNSELPSLELRLNELWNVVDVFFINESTISWKAIPFKNQTLKPKPLYVTEHLKDFEKFQSKIVVHVIPPEVSQNTKYDGSYAIEMAQRDEVWGGLQRMLEPQPDDLLMFNDLDEIPRPDIIEKLACDPPDHLRTPICLNTKQGFFYYNYRCRLKKEWNTRPRLSLYRDGEPGACRTNIPDGATHCSSCFGTLDYVRDKIMSNADPMADTPEQLNDASILHRIRNCKDVYLREDQNSYMEFIDSVDESKMPMIVNKHPERWPYLLGKGPLYEEESVADAHPTKDDVEGRAIAVDDGPNQVAVTTRATCKDFNISPVAIPDPSSPKYIVFYPRAGMGNVLIGYISAVLYGCLTGRILKIAPYNQRENEVFVCPEYFDANTPDSICHDLEMDDNLRRRYESSSVAVKTPEAWDASAHCNKNKQHLEYFLCDDGSSNHEFIAVSSCHYWGDLLYDNPHFKSMLPHSAFRDVLRTRISPSIKVKEKMLPEEDGQYAVCIHVRNDAQQTTRALGDGWVDSLGTCVRSILSRTFDSNVKKEVMLFTMHEDVRKSIKQSLENGSGDQHLVHFSSETEPRGSGGHSSDRHQGIADMFSLGKKCINLLPSHDISTFFIAASNLMEDVKVFPSDHWKNGCLEGSEVTDMIPVSAYWTEGYDCCNLKKTTCQMADGTKLNPSLRYYEKKTEAATQTRASTGQLASVQYSSPPATIVTAYFSFDSKHPHERYMGWMKNILSLKDPMVIYTTPDMVPSFHELRRHASNSTKIITMELNQTLMGRRYDIQFWQDQHEKDPEKHIHQHYYLYWIWNEKPEFLRRTIEENPFHSDFFAWVDIGYFREPNYNNQVMLQQIPAELKQDQILGLDVRDISSEHMGGGFIGGYKTGILRFHTIFYDLLEANQDKFIGKDQDWFRKACIENEGLCLLIKPDRNHGDAWFYMAPYMIGLTAR